MQAANSVPLARALVETLARSLHAQLIETHAPAPRTAPTGSCSQLRAARLQAADEPLTDEERGFMQAR